MTKKIKIWKTSIMLLLSLTFLMMVAASINAEEIAEEVIPRTNETPLYDNPSNDLTDDLVISPSPEPILIEPGLDVIYEEILIDDNTSNDLTDDLVISPNPEPMLINPNSNSINEENEKTDNLVIAGKTAEQPEISTMTIPTIAITVVIAIIVVSLIILKIKK